MKNEKLKILLIDDDDILVEGLTRALESAGFSVESLGSIKEAAKRLGPDYKQADFDVIILDILLPDGLGFDLLKKIRSFGCTVPVIILSSQNNELDKISGLDIGADDYICKPFSLLELKSRIKAAIRRSKTFSEIPFRKAPKKFCFKNLEVNFETGKAFCFGKCIHLSYTELNILKVLIMNPERVIGRDELINLVWGNNFIESTSLAPHISRLRKKITPYEELINNIPKIGYSINFEISDKTPLKKK